MSKEETQINKTEDLMTLLVKATTKTSESMEKLAGDVKTLITKLGDSNPVAHGPVLEAKPKQSDEQEIGDPIKAPNAYNENHQASIIHSENPQSDSDKDGLSMEHKKSTKVKKEESEKESGKDDEEEEVNITVNEKENEGGKGGLKKNIKDMKKTHNASGFDYVKVEAVRPAIFAKTFEGTPATGYEILKAIQSGWNGKFTDADSSMSEAYQRLSKGEFGMGVPGEF